VRSRYTRPLEDLLLFEGARLLVYFYRGLLSDPDVFLTRATTLTYEYLGALFHSDGKAVYTSLRDRVNANLRSASYRANTTPEAAAEIWLMLRLAAQPCSRLVGGRFNIGYRRSEGLRPPDPKRVALLAQTLREAGGVQYAVFGGVPGEAVANWPSVHVEHPHRTVVYADPPYLGQSDRQYEMHTLTSDWFSALLLNLKGLAEQGATVFLSHHDCPALWRLFREHDLAFVAERLAVKRYQTAAKTKVEELLIRIL
jgi:site-specific DNA-adenine methylase